MDENQLCNLLASKASPPSRIVGMIFLYMYPRIWPHVKNCVLHMGCLETASVLSANGTGPASSVCVVFK